MKVERKYLERHAEREIDCAQHWPKDAAPYRHVVTIPACGEGQSLIDTLDSVPTGGPGNVLVILVVNQRESAPDWVGHSNHEMLSRLRTRGGAVRQLAPNIELISHARHDLLLVDRTPTGCCLPPDQGVGLARKIGADIAFQLQADGLIDAKWIHCTDADALLPRDYFERAAKSRGPSDDQAAALVYDFSHDISSEADAGQAMLRYEIYLRYYVLGLRSADSAYAYQTVGSTLAIGHLAYAQVRGFPRRQAAEDFHMLAKLAKVGRIERLGGEPIVLSARGSDRVPFGTGAAINKARERRARGEPFLAYDPRVFCWLGVWLRALHDLTDPLRRDSDLREHLRRRTREEVDIDADVLWSVLDGLGAIAAAEQAIARRGDIARGLTESFDALKTLRFIHALRDVALPDVPIETAICAAPFLKLDRADREPPLALEAICRKLAQQEAKAN